MSGPDAAWVVALVGGAATFLVRALFPALAGRLTALPPPVREGLRMIPPAALSALVLPAMLRTDGALVLISARSLAGLAAAVVAFRTRSVLATIGVGMLAVFLLRLVPGLG